MPEEKPEKAPVKKVRKIPAVPLVNWIVLLVLFLAVAYTGYATHTVLNETEATVTVPSGAKVADLPTLKLHQNHQRQAPEVQVDQGQIGRPDPLIKP